LRRSDFLLALGLPFVLQGNDYLHSSSSCYLSPLYVTAIPTLRDLVNPGHVDFQNSCHALQGIFTTDPYLLFAYFESCLIERKFLISRPWTRRKLSIVKAFYALNSNTVYSCSHIAAGVSTNSLKNCNMHLFHALVIPPSSLHYRCLKSEISILVS
jgi:hypothetical protein